MKTKFITLAVAVVMIVMAMSVTAFAATGTWKQDEQTQVWSCLDKEGNAITEDWVKSGDDWFWLNADGNMATAQLVEYNDNLYCVDETGKMIKNNWVFVNTDEFDNRWLYFGMSGRAFRDGWKTVNNKKYFFENYAMNYGWLFADGTMVDAESEDPWKVATYYCGSNADGAQRANKWVEVSSFEAESGKAWVYFDVNGKKVTSCKKTINGATYIFNADGSMKTSFVDATSSESSVSITAYLDENGKMLKKGWVWAFADDEAEVQNWFYADARGELIKGIVKTINGKKYAFDEDGKMLTGFVKVNKESGEVESQAFASDDVTFKMATSDLGSGTFMYFAENSDPNKQGAALTGKIALDCADCVLKINFSSRGFAQGSDGEFVIKKNFAFINDVLYARADMDYKYEVIVDEAGDFYVLTVATGKASKKGTFTDNDNNVRYIIADGVVTVQHKDANNKWS